MVEKLLATGWRCLAWPKHPAVLSAHARIASGLFLPGLRVPGKSRRGDGKVASSQQEAQKAQGRIRFQVKRFCYLVLVVYILFGSSMVSRMYCRFLAMSQISLTFLASWLVCDFVAVHSVLVFISLFFSIQ